jgi:hypothetical protein
MKMGRFLKIVAVGMLFGVWSSNGVTEEDTKAQVRLLDEQVQDFKSEVLDISSSLIQLDQNFSYPENTRVSIFLEIGQGNKSLFDEVILKIDGKDITQYKYTPMEFEALQRGGIQRIYTGNIQNGAHSLAVELFGIANSGMGYQQKAELIFTKNTGAKLISITLASPTPGNQGIIFNE